MVCTYVCTYVWEEEPVDDLSHAIMQYSYGCNSRITSISFLVHEYYELTLEKPNSLLKKTAISFSENMTKYILLGTRNFHYNFLLGRRNNSYYKVEIFTIISTINVLELNSITGDTHAHIHTHTLNNT